MDPMIRKTVVLDLLISFMYKIRCFAELFDIRASVRNSCILLDYKSEIINPYIFFKNSSIKDYILLYEN